MKKKEKEKFAQLELVIPFWKSIRFMGGEPTRALLELGPTVVDPKAIAEAQISRKEIEELRDLLDRFLQNEDFDFLALYVRDPKKPIHPKNKTLLDFAEDGEDNEDEE